MPAQLDYGRRGRVGSRTRDAILSPVTPRVLLVTLAGAAAMALASGGEDGGPRRAVAADGDAGASGSSRIALRRVGSFSSPTYVTAPRGDRTRLFVVEQGGRIRVIHEGRRLDRPFLNIRGRVAAGGERGLLSMAFAPDYASSGLFYVYFTDNSGDIRIQEFRRSGDANVADRASARNVLTVGHRRFSNHNGGQLQFGPDGMLYIGTGDGGGGGDPLRSAQRLSTRLGKLLRIDPRRSRLPAVPGAARQPVPQQERGAPGDLGARPAQPVAVLVRPADRRPRDRRRRPERARGGRLRAAPRSRCELRLERLRGHAALPLRQPCGATGGRCSSGLTRTAGARSPAAT